MGERLTPDAPHPGRRRPPPGTLMPPQERANPARNSARCGAGYGSPCPHPPHPQPVGSGPRLHARKDEWSGVGERPTPDAPHQGRRRPPRAPSCRPHSAQTQLGRPARKSARVGVGDGSPRPQPPHPQSQGSGPRPHARKDEWSGVGERPTSDAPHQGKRRPPGAPSCRRHSAQSQLARARAVGLVTGPHARNPRTHRQWVVGPGRTPERTSGRGREGAQPQTPQPRQEAPPSCTVMPPPERAKPARKSARCGVGDGSPCPHPPHPQPVGSGPRPHD